MISGGNTGNNTSTSTINTRTAMITIGGDYNVKITPSASSVKPGDTVTLNAVPQQYNPARKTYTDVTGKTYTVSWTVTEGSDVVTLNSRTGSSVTLTAKSGGTATITAETTIDGNAEDHRHRPGGGGCTADAGRGCDVRHARRRQAL